MKFISKNKLFHCFLWLFLLINSSYSSAQTTTVALDPSNVTKSVNDEFTIDVTISDVVNIHGASTVVSFDPDVLEVLSVYKGPFLSSGGQSTQAFTDFNNTEGWAQRDEAILGPYTVSGNGVLVRITFRAKNVGESDLTFSTVDLRHLDDNPISAATSEGIVYVGEVLAKLKIWLEGPYQAGGSMTTQLNAAGYIPLLSPCTEAPRTVSDIPTGVTDWILVELRSSPSGSAVGKQSFFLKSDGNIVDIDGTTTNLAFGGITDGNYYIVVKHLNHLAVMSSADQALNSSSATPYDFTTGTDKYYGSDAALVETGVYGMYAGETNDTGTITTADKGPIVDDLDKSGYYKADTNMTGTVTTADKASVVANLDKSTAVN